jgi:hypothetical protein
MTDWIAKYYPEKMSYDEVRVAVKAAWDAFPAEELEALSLKANLPDRAPSQVMTA